MRILLHVCFICIWLLLAACSDEFEANGGETLLETDVESQELSSDDEDEEMRFVGHDLSVQSMFERLQQMKAENAAQDELELWLFAYMERMTGSRPDSYKAGNMVENLAKRIDESEIPADYVPAREELKVNQYVWGELKSYASVGTYIENDNIRAVVEDAEQLGLEFYTHLGVFDLRVNYQHFLDQFGHAVRDAFRDYLQIMVKDTHTWIEDIYLRIDLFELAEQVIAIDHFFEAYPEFVYSEPLFELKSRYVRAYFTLHAVYDEREVFDHYQRVSEQYPDRDIGRWTEDFVQAYRQFQRQVQDERRVWIWNYVDGILEP